MLAKLKQHLTQERWQAEPSSQTNGEGRMYEQSEYSGWQDSFLFGEPEVVWYDEVVLGR